MDQINKLSDLNYDNVKNELFDEDWNLKAKAFFRKYRNVLAQKDVPMDVINALCGNNDGSEELKVLPDAMSQVASIDNLFNGEIARQIIRVQSPGSAFIQRSIWLMEGHGTFGGRSLNNGQKLKMVNEEGSMDCVLSEDFFVEYDENGYPYFKLGEDIVDGKRKRHYFTKEVTGEDGKKRRKVMSFEERRQWYIDNDLISGIKTGETEWHNAES